MKITKKMRKKTNGMNAITKQHFADGFRNPHFRDIAPEGSLPNFVKVLKGIPYVNAANFT
tara:strand:+ start:346 stop:525 length:180 start_codon:yes stop_codon:yes gene_type:complete